MSSRNDEAQGMAVALGLVATAFIFAAMFVFAVATFLAVIMTLVAFYAWDKPRKLFGETLYPHEARAFVYGGIAGTFLLPIFAVFAAILLKFQIPEHYVPYLFIGGYVAGSFGVAYLQEQAKDNGADLNPPAEVKPPAPSSPPARLDAPRQPFEYASWDDEDRRS